MNIKKNSQTKFQKIDMIGGDILIIQEIDENTVLKIITSTNIIQEPQIPQPSVEFDFSAVSEIPKVNIFSVAIT